MLSRVLEAIERSEGGVDLRVLSRDLGIEPSALQGMIQYWVRKGRLVERSAAGADDDPDVPRCFAACGGERSCPLLPAAPPTVPGGKDKRA